MMIVCAVDVLHMQRDAGMLGERLKNSRTSSVSNVPIFGAVKATFQTRKGRPETSTAARVIVSSIARSIEA